MAANQTALHETQQPVVRSAVIVSLLTCEPNETLSPMKDPLRKTVGPERREDGSCSDGGIHTHSHSHKFSPKSSMCFYKKKKAAVYFFQLKINC